MGRNMRLRAITISILVEQFNMNSSNVAVPVARAALIVIVLLPGDLSLVVGKP